MTKQRIVSVLSKTVLYAILVVFANSVTLAIIPILVFYFIFRNQITKGVAAGAVKG